MYEYLTNQLIKIGVLIIIMLSPELFLCSAVLILTIITISTMSTIMVIGTTIMLIIQTAFLQLSELDNISVIKE